MLRKALAGLVVVLLVAVMFVGCGLQTEKPASVVAPTQEDSVTQKGPVREVSGVGYLWPNLSQAQRNSYLISYGLQDVDDSGLTCKEYIQDLVHRVTDWTVIVPQNVTNTGYYRFMWETDPYGHIAGQSMDIRNTSAGHIVQMSWDDNNEYLHTFLITQKTAQGMYVLDSNWSYPPDYTVRYRYWSYEQFENRSDLRYGVYTIGW